MRPNRRLAEYWCADGIVVLGGPQEAPSLSSALELDSLRLTATPFGELAGPFLRAFLAAKLESMQRASSLVLELAAKSPHDFPALQVALLLLVYCVAPKADHLLRHLPPSVGSPLASHIDQLLLETLQSLFEVKFTAKQTAQAQFSLSQGGWDCEHEVVATRRRPI